MRLEIYTFEGIKKGHHLLIFGAIHGNEKCGSQACFKMIKKLEEGSLKLSSGKVTFIPICNPKSYANNVRYTDIDLNRIIQNHHTAKHYEQYIANELITQINQCDTLLDLHSMSADSKPCIFMDYPTKENISLSKVIDVPHVLIAWEKVYEKASECQSTEHYAHKNGKSVITLECGQHASPQAPEIAYNAIYQTFIHLKLLQKPFKRLKETQQYYKFTHMFRKKEGSKFSQNWSHMQHVEKGSLIGEDKHHKYICEKSAIIVMPAPHAKIGSEWFYLAEKINNL